MEVMIALYRMAASGMFAAWALNFPRELVHRNLLSRSRWVISDGSSRVCSVAYV